MQEKPKNLQDIKITSEVIEAAAFDGGWSIHLEKLSQQDFSQIGEDGKTRVLFRQLERHLIDYIKQYEIIVGCVAWLTNETILDALAQVKGVSLVIQKEDFLRPDLTPDKNWTKKLRRLYDQLPGTLICPNFEGTILRDMWLGDYHGPEIEPVRCVGNFNASKSPAFPRSHHKFIVFCRMNEKYIVQPEAVWTGSYNFSKTAEHSFENAVVLHDTQITHAFFNEYIQIVSLSEALDWKTEWARPQWYKWNRKHPSYQVTLPRKIFF